MVTDRKAKSLGNFVSARVSDSELSRGDIARQSLIKAGVKVFGSHSLSSASTRQIANQAGQNIASIAYYFGSKQGLYQAVVKHIVSILDSRNGAYPGFYDFVQRSLGAIANYRVSAFGGLLRITGQL